jgi:hypothetical protein
VGKHSVNYNGRLIGKVMTGKWSIGDATGNFEISEMQKQWDGYYLQGGSEHSMSINHFEINRGDIFGEGSDQVGTFMISGRAEDNG